MVWTFIVKFLNAGIRGLGKALAVIMILFPDSPFEKIFGAIEKSPIAKFLGTMNYFLPIAEIVSIGVTYLACISIYYFVSTAARWVKAIE